MDNATIAELATLVFAIVTMTPWVLERNPQIFQPMKLWSALQVATVVPAAFLVAHNPNYLHPDVIAACSQGVPLALANTMLVYSLLNASTILSYYVSISRMRDSKVTFRSIPALNRADSVGVVATFLIVGVVGFMAKLWLAGGLEFLFANISRRTELQGGLGPLNSIVDVAFLMAVLIMVRRFALRGRTHNLLLLIVAFTLAAATSTVFGSRKATLQLVLVCLIVYSACRPQALHMSARTLLGLMPVYAATFLYFFFVLAYRTANDVTQVVEMLPSMIDLAARSFAEMLLSMSYLDTYIFIVAHYSVDNFYYGSTFFDLTTAFLPSAVIPDKPPVDDGLYVRQAALGVRLEPLTPARFSTDYASWPPETLGAAYMNGGTILVPVFGVTLGLVLARGYLFTTRRPNSVFWLVILTNLFLNFEISNLRIASLITTGVASMVLVAFVQVLVELRPRAARRHANFRRP